MDSDPPPLQAWPSDGRPVSALQCQVPVIVVFDVLDGKSKLTEPDGDWIRTTWSTRLVTIIKDATGKLRSGAAFRIDADGGELTIAKAHISAVVPWARPFEAGKRYLAFVSLTRKSDPIIDMFATYEVTPTGLRRMTDRPVASTPKQDDLQGRTDADVVAKVQGGCGSQ